MRPRSASPAPAAAAGSSGQGGFPTTTEATLGPTTEATTEAVTEPAITAPTPTVTGLASADCRDLAGISQKFAAALSGAASSEDLETEARLLKEFAAKGPAEIRGAFTTLAGYTQKLADAGLQGLGSLKPGETPDPATLAKLQKLASEIDAAKLSQAVTSITQWLAKNCVAVR